jgi:hypothetical protein
MLNNISPIKSIQKGCVRGVDNIHRISININLIDEKKSIVIINGGISICSQSASHSPAVLVNLSSSQIIFAMLNSWDNNTNSIDDHVLFSWQVIEFK